MKVAQNSLSGKVGQMSATRNGIFEEENTFLTRCFFAAELKYYPLCDQNAVSHSATT